LLAGDVNELLLAGEVNEFLLVGVANEFLLLCCDNVVVIDEPLERFEYRMYAKQCEIGTRLASVSIIHQHSSYHCYWYEFFFIDMSISRNGRTSR